MQEMQVKKCRWVILMWGAAALLGFKGLGEANLLGGFLVRNLRSMVVRILGVSGGNYWGMLRGLRTLVFGFGFM